MDDYPRSSRFFGMDVTKTNRRRIFRNSRRDAARLFTQSPDTADCEFDWSV